MEEHKIFRPLSHKNIRHAIGSFEVPAEDHTSLSVVTLALFVARVFSLPYRFFSMLIHVASVEYQGRAKELIFQIAGFGASIFIIVLLLSTLESVNTLMSLRTEVVGNSLIGIDTIHTGVALALSDKSGEALIQFQKSEEAFYSAQTRLRSIDPLVLTALRVTPILGSKVQSGEKVIRAGLDVSRSAQQALRAYDSLRALRQNDTQKIKNALVIMKESLTHISPLIEDASQSLQSVSDTAIPRQYRNAFDSARHELSYAHQNSGLLSETLDALLDSIGTSTVRRYLLLFQNNAELRPTGGFIGSIALVDIVNGEIKRVEIPPGGPYDLRGSFHERLNPPEPLRLVASEWQFQDANWWADFPTSAKKVLWFYEKSGGPTVDGVIALNASLIPKLLSLTGPLALQQYGKNLSADSALLEIQKSVETEYDKTVNKPKQIIADLFPILMKALTDSQTTSSPQFAALMFDALVQKDIQFYFRNSSYQELAGKFNITGKVKEFQPDYSMIVSANIGGGKSDAVISSSVDHIVTLNADGTFDATLTLHRKHSGVKGDVFTGMQHNDYVRFYAPKDSVFIASKGFAIPKEEDKKPLLANHADDQDLIALQSSMKHFQDNKIDQWNEKDKTVFGGWLFTKPSTESEIQIQYRLPFSRSQLLNQQGKVSYALLIQRQSGSTIDSYTSSFVIPNNGAIDWKYGGAMDEQQSNDGARYHTDNFRGEHYLGFSLKN